MKIEFEQLSETSRLWVYQADRKLQPKEIAILRNITDDFIDSWQAHGQTLAASYELRFDQFLVISVDESYNGASGCSIDASVALVRQLEQTMGISFLDRSKVAILAGEDVTLRPLTLLKKDAAEGKLPSDAKVFNNAVSTLADYRMSWIQPAKESWLGRYFN